VLNELDFPRDYANLREKRFLVVGATGHVGSKVAIRLAEKGYDVTALVRREGATIRDPFNGLMKYVVGDLRDLESMRKAVTAKDVVISTANRILPQRRGDNAKNVNEGALELIRLCEEAGVARFVQSSVPPYKYENDVPELRGKRMIEARLKQSNMQSIVIRNAAFMDVFIPMGGFRQAQDASLHAATKREYVFAQTFMAMTGDLVEKYGIFLAPGGASQGTPIIATRDVAEMMVGGALYEGADNLLIEAGGPEWLTWGEIADKIAKKTGRRKVRVLPMPAWMIRINRALAAPFSPAAENMFALMGFVANFQPRWEAPPVVERFKLPKQMTVQDYLDTNYDSSRVAKG
jgi:uncharacterized protein YbjT (DUF2867 family)